MSDNRISTSLLVVVTEGSHLPVFLKHLELDLASHFNEVIVASLCNPDNPFIKTIEDKYTIINLNPKDFPEFFYKDNQSSFSEADGEFKWLGPFSDEKKIINWAKVRNLGFSRCSQEYRVVVYEDEIIDHPENIQPTIHLMRESHSDVAYTKRNSIFNDGYVPRVSRNFHGIRWFGSVDETLDGITRYIVSDELLKAMVFSYQEKAFEKAASVCANATVKKLNIYPKDLISLARYSVPFFGLSKGTKLISDYLEISLYTEERSWACAVWGEILEKAGRVDEAAIWYRRSMDEHPGWKSAMRLCRILFHQKKFDEVLETFSEGVQNLGNHHIVDDGNESVEKTMVLVAVCNHRLGNRQEALENCRVLNTLFPNNRKIQTICEKISNNDLV